MKATKKQLAEQLGDVALFGRCSKRDLRTIARHLEIIEVAADTKIVEQGAHGDAFFVLLSGSAEVIRDDTVAASLSVGAHFGELALLDPGPRSATVITRDSCELGVLSVRMFRVLLRDMPQIAERLLSSLAEQLRQARDR